MRRTGRTTRIIDAAIQEFFTNGEVTVIDHWWEGKKDNSYAFNLFLKRLDREHHIPRSAIDIDHTLMTVKFKDNATTRQRDFG